MKQTPLLTKEELDSFIQSFFENWAHLKDMADGLQRIAAVLERMDAHQSELEKAWSHTAVVP